MGTWRVARAFAVAAGLISILTGCISTRPLDEETLKSLKGGGAAVLRVAYDRDPERGDGETYVLAARVHRVGKEGSPRARLVRSSDGSYFSTTLGGGLEPGSYWVYGLETMWLGTSRIHYFDYDSLLFEVRPNEISVIGTVVLSRDGAPPRFVSPQADPAGQWVNETFPAAERFNVKVNFSPNVSTAFSLPKADRDVVDRQGPPKASWVQLANGDFAAPGRLGTIVYRHRASSQISMLDIGAWSSALFVSNYKGGLVVAGEEGLLRFSADGKSGWQALRAPGRGAIHAIQPLSGGKVAAVVRSGVTWTAYVTDDLIGGQWRQLATFDFAQFPNPLWQPVPFLAAAANKIGVFHFDGSHRIVDLQSGDVQSSEPSSVVKEMLTAADGTVVLRIRLAGNTEVSTDGGTVWSKVDLPASSVLVSLAGQQTIYAVAPETPGVTQSGFVVHVSRDAGKSWLRAGDAPIAFGQATKLWASSGDRLQIELRDGAVLESVDAGAHWARLPK